jgi:hypothetical protein
VPRSILRRILGDAVDHHVNANGTIRLAGNIDPKCTGHLGESTPTGASNPVTEQEGPESAASAAASLPTLRLSSKGEEVRKL